MNKNKIHQQNLKKKSNNNSNLNNYKLSIKNKINKFLIKKM